ncbi:hypothetical protein [Marinobacter mobilis]|uniref:hypothetical protein n=1 Tax=Marinobacter mobilis TaxID=488533 RepID=UPI0035C6B23C
MRHASQLRATAALLVATLLSACASTPPVTSTPVDTTDTNAHRTPPPPVQPIPRCAWSQVRGVATILSVTSAMANPALATWQFFPGDDIVFHPLPGGAARGDEYKALLRRPMTGPCEAELYLVGPL